MTLKRWLGIKDKKQALQEARGTESVRQIASHLKDIHPDMARFLAAFTYVLARVAYADLAIDSEESQAMEQILKQHSGLSENETQLVITIANSQARIIGATDNYLVTREFREISNRQQRGQLLECLFAVAASDGSISNVESSEITAIGEELGFTRAEVSAYRARYRDKLSLFQSTK